MASAQHLEDLGAKESEGTMAAVELQKKDMGHHIHDHDFVMVNEDANSSQGQVLVSCAHQTLSGVMIDPRMWSASLPYIVYFR